jgi:DNA-3-methyladenine glycosylase
MDFDLLNDAPELVAQRLLGAILARELDGQTVRVRIVETEAYHQNDAASHSYRGRTTRTEVMFGPAGHLYVYFTYGMHYCMNVVTGPEGEGSAVLIRAVESLDGQTYMALNRPGHGGVTLTNGPAKLCQALAIDKSMNGHDLRQPPCRLLLQPALPAADIVQTVRIGISQAQDVPWRFYVRDNPYVSQS